MYPYQDEHNAPYQNQSASPEAAPVWEQPSRRPPKRHTGLKVTALLCACLLISGAAGFGGGYLALSLQSSNVQPAAAASAATPAAEPAAPSAAPAVSSTPSGGAMSVSEVVSAVSDSVVAINTEVTMEVPGFFTTQQTTGTAAGSGVIISEDGYILTNNHVIEDATKISVTLKNGESYDATLIGADAQTDLAVVKIEAEGLSAATVGSSASLAVGDETIAIGNPLGELGGTVTNGIVSALDRQITLDDHTMTLLQTNAAINPGNSGGGLFNNRGELIGIVVAKSSGVGVEGLGFAIPIDNAMVVANDLIENGYVTGRGELGVAVIDIQDARTAFYYRVPGSGVYIASVTEGSAAERAGLKIGDGITAVNGTEISSADELSDQLALYKAGDTVDLTVQRDGSSLIIPVTFQEKVPESVRQQNA